MWADYVGDFIVVKYFVMQSKRVSGEGETPRGKWQDAGAIGRDLDFVSE
jgi:hypothetical protein